ncbi:MAG: hypothetical protein ACTHJ8_01140 [Mucilaginibacter sp.]|jgi:hypothetical protein
MHPQITAVLNNVNPYCPRPNNIAGQNAEKVLNYIEDLNLERNVRFRQTSAGSLFMAWRIGEWEYEMECVKNGYIIYTFTKEGYEKASGCLLFDDFIPQFEKYLLML